jgi:dTDP-4-dehydrorhamnose reductase
VKIFLTGKQGMLARAITEELSPRHQVIGASHVEADITDENALRRMIEAARPDVVVNAAAFTDVDRCETQEELAFRVNAQGPRNLAIICKDLDISLMHISTDYVFDGEKAEPYVEEDTPNPLSVYGRSKLQGETEVRNHLDRSWIVRVCGVFGPYRSNFVKLVVDLGKKGQPLRIVKDQRLAPTYTFDAAVGIEQILRRGPYGLYHLTNQGFTSRIEFTREILGQAGFENVPVIPISTEETRRPAPRPQNSQLENARMKREGLALLPAWEDAVQRYLVQLSAGNSR